MDARPAKPCPNKAWFEHAPSVQVGPDGREILVTDKDGNWEARNPAVPNDVVTRLAAAPVGVWISPRTSTSSGSSPTGRR